MGTNHAAAKGAIAAFTVAVATEMLPYGVTVNAVSPAAVRTRMATHVGARLPDPVNGFDSANPELVAPLVAYLASEEAGWISGQIFRLVGGKLGRYQPWTVAATLEKEDGWSAEDLQAGMPRLMGTYPGSIPIPP
jgi:NAD(P)-dependent dehydrogenase (short-subunit alcohol dehydrogenase family)